MTSVGASRWGRLESLASADRRHAQVQRGVARVPAFVDERFGRLVTHTDLYQLFDSAVRFPKVSAESALSIV
jgi:hypothetical protein